MYTQIVYSMLNFSESFMKVEEENFTLSDPKRSM